MAHKFSTVRNKVYAVLNWKSRRDRVSIGALSLLAAALAGCAAATNGGRSPAARDAPFVASALPSGIAVENPIPAWEQLDEITLEFALPPGVNPESWPRDPYQSIHREAGVCRITLRRVRGVHPDQISDAQRRRALASTDSIQCAHPDIRRRALAESAPPRNDAMAVGRRLAAWVRPHMTGRPAREPATDALETLRTGAGDCTEHSYLLCALARAAGIPSRVAAGLAYRDGALRFHAWNELYVNGGWTPFDTTFGRSESLPPVYFVLGYEYGEDREDAPYVWAVLEMARVESIRVVSAASGGRRFRPGELSSERVRDDATGERIDLWLGFRIRDVGLRFAWKPGGFEAIGDDGLSLRGIMRPVRGTALARSFAKHAAHRGVRPVPAHAVRSSAAAGEVPEQRSFEDDTHRERVKIVRWADRVVEVRARVRKDGSGENARSLLDRVRY